MPTYERDRALAAELRRLGEDVPVTGDDDDLIAQVMARLQAEPAPGWRARTAGYRQRAGDWLRARRRAVAAVLAALLVGLVITPPVRATVAEWFGFGGVIIREAPGSGPPTAPPPPSATSELTLGQARELVTFVPVVPSALGTPDGVEVSDDRRVLSLTWPDDGQPVRLDQFDGTLSPVMAKLAHGATIFTLAGTEYLWVERPHEVVVVAPDGTERSASARLAASTLIWERARTTLRLEADVNRERAVAIARSMKLVG